MDPNSVVVRSCIVNFPRMYGEGQSAERKGKEMKGRATLQDNLVPAVLCARGYHTECPLPVPSIEHLCTASFPEETTKYKEGACPTVHR